MEIFRFHWLSLQLKFSCHYLLDSGEDFVSNCQRSSFFFNSSFPTSLMPGLYQAFRCLQAPCRKIFLCVFSEKNLIYFFSESFSSLLLHQKHSFSNSSTTFPHFLQNIKNHFFSFLFIFFSVFI